MGIDAVQILENAAVIERFEGLRASKANPSLAVYKGRKLVIASEDGSGLIGKIARVFNGVFNSILTWCGVLSTNPTAIQKLRDNVAEYFRNRAKKEMHDRLDQEISALQGQLGSLTETIANGERTLAVLRSTIEGEEGVVARNTAAKAQLESQIKAAAEQLVSLQGEMARHTCHLDQCEKAKGMLAALEAKKESLLLNVAQINREYEQLQSKKEEMARLSAALQSLQAQIEALKSSEEQNDFRRRYAEIASINQQLQGEVKGKLGVIEDLKRVKGCLQSEIDSNYRCIAQLRVLLEEAKHSSHTRIESFEGQVRQLTGQNQLLQAEIARLKAGSTAGETRVHVGQKH
jgi:DNA repair exonuclease SbcCD ATPase subunit